MNILLLLLLLLLLQPLFFCTLLSGSKFNFTFSSFVSHLQHQKKILTMMIIIIVAVIRMIIPELVSVSQFVCNNVATTSQWITSKIHAHGWIFHISKVTRFVSFSFFSKRHTICLVQWMFNSVLLLPPPPPPDLSPVTSSPSVSLAVFLCSLSMCSAKPVSK